MVSRKFDGRICCIDVVIDKSLVQMRRVVDGRNRIHGRLKTDGEISIERILRRGGGMQKRRQSIDIGGWGEIKRHSTLYTPEGKIT